MSKELLCMLYDRVMKLKEEELVYFLGKVLTIVDSSIQDQEQRKAMKDLIKQARWEYKGNNPEYEFRKFGKATGMKFYGELPLHNTANLNEYNPYQEK